MNTSSCKVKMTGDYHRGSSTVTSDTSVSSKGISSQGNIVGFDDDIMYEEVKLSECEYDPDTKIFYYLCTCGDVFELTLDNLLKGNVIAECPSCSLKILVRLELNELDKYK